MLSIIVPVLNEAKNIKPTLQYLQRVLPKDSELIVVDGGSHDNTLELAAVYSDKVIRSEAGRAKQMNAGAALAKGKLLLFMHSDTYLPKPALYALLSLSTNQVPNHWGFFPVRLSGTGFWFRVIERCINLRSRWTSIATGDQCIFIRKDLFEKGGYQDIPLMEDVEISKRLRKSYTPNILPYYAHTSSRRWEQKGIFRTILLMWVLRLLYFLGVSPVKLADYYR